MAAGFDLLLKRTPPATRSFPHGFSKPCSCRENCGCFYCRAEARYKVELAEQDAMFNENWQLLQAALLKETTASEVMEARKFADDLATFGMAARDAAGKHVPLAEVYRAIPYDRASWDVGPFDSPFASRLGGRSNGG